MEIKRFFLFLGTGLGLILPLNFLPICAQSGEVVKESDSKIITKVIRRKGWQMIRKHSLVLTKEGTEEFSGIQITVKSYKPKQKLRVDVEWYYLTKENNVSIGKTNLQVRNVISYEVNGHKYGVSVTYVPYSVSRGREEILGALITRFFSDEDGDGVFESQYQTRRSWEMIPDWVKAR